MLQPERETRPIIGYLFSKFVTTQSPNLQFIIFLLGHGLSLLPACLRDLVLFPVMEVPKPKIKIRSSFIRFTHP